MVPEIAQLRRAGRMLADDITGDPETLVEAASEVWSAMASLADWPADLRMRAVELQGDLFREGSIGVTVREMSEEERDGLRKELLEFVEMADRLDLDGETAGSHATFGGGTRVAT